MFNAIGIEESFKNAFDTRPSHHFRCQEEGEPKSFFSNHGFVQRAEIRGKGDKADDLISAYEFTEILHKHLDEKEKARIVSLLWQIAYADGQLDKYEDSLVLKISDLLGVSRGRVMRLKHDAKLAAS